MFKLLLLVACIPALALGQGFPFRPCQNGQPAPSQVRIVGCPTAPCRVQQDSLASMQIDFTTRSHVTALTPNILAHLSPSASVPYPLPAQFHNACNHLGGHSCPLTPNTPVTFFFQFHVNRLYPPVPVGVQVSLNRPDGVETCAIIDILVSRS